MLQSVFVKKIRYAILKILLGAKVPNNDTCGLFHASHPKYYYSILTQTPTVKKQKNYNICRNSPLLNFGSNHVDFGGISMPASATANSSAMEVGYMEKATASFCCVSFT